MVREIMKDMFFLSQPSSEAGREDLPAAQDLLDTLGAHREECVGMAANMIGVRKRIIVFMDGEKPVLMLNPVIVRKSLPYDTEEGCLSLSGKRPAKRWKNIKVAYQDEQLRPRFKSYSGWTAQIIQHEIDHLSGILI